MEKQEILNKVMEYIERSRKEYFEIINKPEQFRSLHELASVEKALIKIECLGMDLGLIKECTL